MYLSFGKVITGSKAFIPVYKGKKRLFQLWPIQFPQDLAGEGRVWEGAERIQFVLDKEISLGKGGFRPIKPFCGGICRRKDGAAGFRQPCRKSLQGAIVK